MSVIIDQAVTGSSRIAYENLFETATTITATDEAVGFEKENAFNWNLFDWWKPASAGTKYLTAIFSSAVIADYFSLFGHNLHAYNDTVKLQYSTNGSTWNDATSAITASVGKVIYVEFDAITAAWWRIEYITTGPGLIGAASFGKTLELPKGMEIGFTPPTFSKKNKYTDKSTVKGVPLPRSIERMPGKIKIRQENIDPIWMRDNWLAFLDHAELKPFIFSWDYDTHPDEAGFCRTTDDPKTSYSSPLLMKTSLTASVLTVLNT